VPQPPAVRAEGHGDIGELRSMAVRQSEGTVSVAKNRRFVAARDGRLSFFFGNSVAARQKHRRAENKNEISGHHCLRDEGLDSSVDGRKLASRRGLAF
jgi:hypothetical protein